MIGNWLKNAKQNIGQQLGSQGTFKNLLPKGVDFGVSEWLAPKTAYANYTPPQPRPVYGPTTPLPRTGDGLPRTGNGLPPISQNNNPIVNNNPVVNNGGGGGGGGDNGGGYSGPSPEELLRQQEEALTQQLEAEYNSAISMAEGQETEFKGQASTAEGQITNEAAKTRTALGAEQAIKQQGVQGQLSTAETGAKTASQQARDLFRQTQQQNIAQLSALGLSSSSVAEALAERLGVETARRIAGVTGGLQEVQQNASKELARINDYYGQKSTQLQTDEQLQKQQIQQSLMSGLRQINTAKQTAAAEKAARRAGLISQVNQSLASLAQQKQQFEQQLKLWAQQKSAALTPLTTPQGLNDIVSNFQNTITANPGINQYQIDARMPIRNEYGSGYITMSNKKPDEENWATPPNFGQIQGQVTGQPDWKRFPHDGVSW